MLTLSCRARSLKRQDEMYQTLKQFDIGRRSVVSTPRDYTAGLVRTVWRQAG